MKFLRPLFLISLSFFTFFTFSCSNVSSDSSSSSSSSSSELNYDYLTSNRTFMGGSLIYDPGDSSGKLTQIKSGTKIAVRLGTLEKKPSSVKTYSVGTDLIESSDTDDAYTNPNKAESDSLQEVTAIFSGSDSLELYEDIPAKATYGYLTVDSVSPASIRLTFTEVKNNNSTSSKTFTIKQGETLDLDGDSDVDLKWDKPILKRTGYSDNARWLTFINKKNSTSSAMFYTFTESAARAGYRATTSEAENVETGLYGVNSLGDFVWLYYDNQNTTKEMAYGDYVVVLPSKQGFSDENYDFVNDSFDLDDDSQSLATDDSSTTDRNEFYDDLDSVANGLSSPDIKFGGKSYVVIDGDSNLQSPDQFSTYNIDYSYNKWQFPDEDNGPAILIEDLCANEAIKTALNFGTANNITEKIARLNTALTEEEFINAVLNANLTDDSKKSAFKTVWGQNNADKTKYARIMLDEFYDASPSAIIEAPEICNIYPDMNINLGSIDSLDDFMYSGNYNLSTEIIDDSSRAIHSTYNSYMAKHKEMEKQWKRFHSIDLSQLVLYPCTKDKTKKIDPQKAGVKLSVGVKFSFNANKSRAKLSTDFAIWLDLDLSLNSVNALWDMLKGPDQSSYMEKKLKKLFGNRKNCEVKLTDVNINVCGVPIVFGAALKTGMNISFGNINPHFCFSGMYGTESQSGVEYGIDWFCKPYIRGNSGAKGLNYTELFIGVEGGSNSTLTIEPWVCLNPSIGLGCSVVSARASFPITTGPRMVFSLAPAVTLKEFGIRISVYVQPYFEADLKLFKIKKTFCTLKPIDHNLRLMPTPIKFIPRKNP